MTHEVEMRGITKRFGHTQANDGIDLTVEKAHIHAVLGENGAGKTTLMRILYGEERPDHGEILIRGNPVSIHNPAHAIGLGIGLIHQHFMLIHEYSITENFALGNEPRKALAFTNYEPVRAEAARILESLDIPLDLDTPVGNFSVEEQQIIEIAKALYRGAEILILDEPTSVLTPQKIENLLETLRSLRRDGKTIILITHKLEEALAVADEITVLRKGRKVATIPREQADRDKLVRMMVGEESLQKLSQDRKPVGMPLVSIEDLCVEREARQVVKHVSFQIHEGEIFGLTGVGGNGQKELVDALVGLRAVSSGIIRKGHDEIQGWSVRARRQAGMAHVPADRIRVGLASGLTVLENLIMGHHVLPRLSQGLWLHVARSGNFAREMIDKFDILAESEAATAGGLSGGNLQKLIIAREFTFDADFLIVAYPSQGIDIRTTSFVHAELLRRRDAGCAILLVSGDLEEVLRLSDRVGVLFGGELVTIKRPSETSRMALGKYMTGVLRDEIEVAS